MPKYKSAQGVLKPLKDCPPSIGWGYGHSPVLKDKCYATLAVAWGPLVQLYILNDVTDESQAFIDDGYYFLQPAQASAETSRTSATSDLNRSKDALPGDGRVSDYAQQASNNPDFMRSHNEPRKSITTTTFQSQRDALEHDNPYEQPGSNNSSRFEVLNQERLSLSHSRESHYGREASPFE